MANYLVIILGPTGIGKTDIAIDIALHFKTEIISADSRQVYKELKIGTATPSSEQLSQVKHYFIGNKSIYDYYNASMFEIEVINLLNILYQKRNVVVMAGGSGMYIDAISKGIDDIPTVDKEIRSNLALRLKAEGIESLRKELKYLDPDYYKRVDLKNPKRILKALEISIQTGKPYSSFLTQKQKIRNFTMLKIGLDIDREKLYSRINKRVDYMIENGLIEEAMQFFHVKNINALNTVGYKEIFTHLEGKIQLEEAIKQIKKNTRNYARKQITWFNRYQDIKWFHPDKLYQIIHYIEQNMNS